MDHRHLFEDVLQALARAGFEAGDGTGLLAEDRPEGIVLRWRPEEMDRPTRTLHDTRPDLQNRLRREGIRTALTATLRDAGYRVEDLDEDLLVTGG